MKILALFLYGTSAHRLHKNHHHHNDNMMLQIDTGTVVNNRIDTHGIFDKAIAKIQREETEKTDAVNLLHELEERQILDNKKQSMHQKHLVAAQKEAMEIFKSMQNEAEMTAQEKLESIVSDQLKQEESEKKQKEEDAAAGPEGFLSGMNKILKDETGENQQQKDRELAIKEKVQTVVAPKMAEEALSQALNIKDKTNPISISAVAEMKKNLALKFAQPKQQVAQTEADTDVGEDGSALDQFDQLKVIQQKQILSEAQKEDIVSDEKKAELDPETRKMNAAHKMQTSPTSEFQAEMNKEIEQDDVMKRQDDGETKQKGPPKVMEEDFDNPISMMTALKHPEIMEHAKERQYDDEMFSHYNGLNRY